MAPESHFSQGGEDADVTDTDFPPHSSSEVSINYFLPSSTNLQDELPKVDTKVAHLPQSDEKVKIADFVHSSSGMLSEILSINVLPCSTDFKGKLSKMEMGPESENADLPQCGENVNIADFVLEGSSIDFLPCSTDFQDKASRGGHTSRVRSNFSPTV